MDLYIIYIFILSLITLIVYVYDKRRAIKNKYRVKEKTLLILSFIGGALGGIIAMYVFRHKNKHWYFVLINFISLIIHFLLAYFVFSQVNNFII